MTNTAVVLGMAPLGKLWAASGCDCAKDRAGSTAISKGIMNFIGFSSRLSFVSLSPIEYYRTLLDEKNYCSAKLLMKKFLASIKICSRLCGSELTRAIINTPAMLANNNLIFLHLSSRV